MKKGIIIRRLALLASIVMMLTSTVQTTYGFIVTKTDPLINIFTPYQKVISDIIINKTVEHPLGDDYVIPEDIAFDFEVDLGDFYAGAEIATTVGTKTADENGVITLSVKPGESVGVNGIDEGTVAAVTEKIVENSGFAVKDGIATIEATVNATAGAAVDFINIYSPEKVLGDIVSVTGVKQLEGRPWQEGDSFDFLLEQKAGEEWTQLGTKTVTYDAENEEFNAFDFSDIIKDIEFTQVGTYSFRISEVEGELEDVDYDKTVNYFDVKIGDKDMDGKLEISEVTAAQNARVTKDDATGRYDISVIFNNTFVPPVIEEPEDVTVDVTVNKTINNTGTMKLGPEGFEFVLENIATGEKRALKTDVNGNAVFPVEFAAADLGNTVKYRLSETDDARSGVTYDTDVYEIELTPILGEDNTIDVNITMNGTAVEQAVAQFENIYHTEQAPSPPTDDSSRLSFWFIMLLASTSVCVTLLIIEKKNKAKQ